MPSESRLPSTFARAFRVAALLLGALVRFAAHSQNLQVTLQDQHGAPVPDAVVSLSPTDGAAVPSATDQVHEIVQQGQAFIPYVTAVPVGSTVVFPNRDRVQHHVYSLSPAKKFELPLYDPGRSERIVFDRAGIVTLGCNIHDWMLAYLVVLPTPWFDRSDQTGHAALTAPAGAYRLTIWQPRLSRPLEQDVTLTAAPTALALTLKLRPDRRLRRAPDSAGGAYD
ncbi:MAG TPA: hypothetical protein VHE13_13785 [Opitutus sp.]|nr:hypothetical protein [Opitutus sp.]